MAPNYSSKVSLGADVRDYTIDTSVGSNALLTEASPLRIGDSFEDMKRKMIPFKIGDNRSRCSHLSKRCITVVPSAEVIEENPQFSTPPVSGRGARATSSELISPLKPVLIAMMRDDSRRSIVLDSVYPFSDAHVAELSHPELARSTQSVVAEQYVAHLMHQIFEKIERERAIELD